MAVTPIVALDVPTLSRAMELVERLGDRCAFYKVGLELFTAEGPRAVEALRSRGHEVFLDLKFHDIPNTVRGAVRSASSMGVRLATVHASGGIGMLEAAREGAGADLGLLGVTVLTSMDAPGLSAAWGRETVDLRSEVLRLAGLCSRAGFHGLVCSGEELPHVRAAYPELAPLVPGIRLAEGDSHDQARVVTPQAAASAGARYLILGRAVTAAADPYAAMGAVLATLGE